jgi:FkbM family methyltransferase
MIRHLKKLVPTRHYNRLRNAYNLWRYAVLWRARKVRSFETDGEKISLVIVDPHDPIQSIQAQGAFYEAEELESIRPWIKRGSIFVDIGANTGQHGIFAVKILGAARAVFFEPIAQTRRILLENIKLNAMEGRCDVSMLGIALSNREGSADFQTNHANLGGSSIRAETSGAIRLMRGDDCLRGMNIDFIKIDTEGHETEVLEGLEETIACQRPTLLVEVDDKNRAFLDAFVSRHDYAVAKTSRRYAENENVVLVPLNARRQLVLT